MKVQNDINALLEENKELRKKLKRVYLALNPRPKPANKRAVIQWTPKEEAIVKEEVKNHGGVRRAFLAIQKRGVKRSVTAIEYRWHTKLKDN